MGPKTRSLVFSYKLIQTFKRGCGVNCALFFIRKVSMSKSTKRKTISDLLNSDLSFVEPIGQNQKKVFDAFNENSHLILHGYAGTGKTFLALYLALDELERHKAYDNITIIRSVVPSRDIGFLPGSMNEKIEIYEEPYEIIVNDLYNRADAYTILKKNNWIQFKSTSFLRGLTENDSIIIVDEIQNMNFQELSTIATRVGENTRIIFCGDYRQSDLLKYNERQELKKFLAIMDRINNVETIEFGANDIIRSEFVKNFILEMERYEKNLQRNA